MLRLRFHSAGRFSAFRGCTIVSTFQALDGAWDTVCRNQAQTIITDKFNGFFTDSCTVSLTDSCTKSCTDFCTDFARIFSPPTHTVAERQCIVLTTPVMNKCRPTLRRMSTRRPTMWEYVIGKHVEVEPNVESNVHNAIFICMNHHD